MNNSFKLQYNYLNNFIDKILNYYILLLTLLILLIKKLLNTNKIIIKAKLYSFIISLFYNT